MSFKLIGNHLSPAEGEIVVRTYHCTNLSPIFAWIGLKTDGYLTVTNKRVVYFAEGSSVYGAAGNSKLYNEVPIADVANLSLSNGTRFSLKRLFFGIVCAITFLIPIVPISAYVAASGALGGNPYSMRFCVFLQLAATIFLGLYSLWIPKERIGRILLATASLSLGLPALILGTVLPDIYRAVIALLSIVTSCYWVWCLYWFVRREYIKMKISSKSGFSHPIDIAGVSWWSRLNFMASQASWMAPAIDANMMFKELGAIVTDIQTLGDHGVEKWLKPSPEATEAIRKECPCRQSAIRYAVAAVLVIGILVGSESVWHSFSAKQALASNLRTKVANAKKIAESDKSVRELVPQMWILAEQETVSGETAFRKYNFKTSMLHWNQALKTYIEIPNAVAAIKNAFVVQSKYDALLVGMYVQETANDHPENGTLLTNFTLLMNQHPGTNDYWQAVSVGVNKAKSYGKQDDWGRAGAAWEYAGGQLPLAVQLMRADLWVGRAENAIKTDDAHNAYECTLNALRELPSYSRASQRKELAGNMMRYSKLLLDEINNQTVNAVNMAGFAARLDLYGGADWDEIQRMVGNAKTLANQNEWEKCNSEWVKALSKLPATILAMQMEKVESEARRGNWTAVSALAGNVLSGHKDHVRARDLKNKADSIIAASMSEKAYRRILSSALTAEVADDHVKTGDMADFIAHMDRYGFEEWAQIKDAVSKAGNLLCAERGIESSSEWMKACAQLPSAVQRMRAEIWMERAEQEVKNNDWAKVIVYAAKALEEKPELARARMLRDRADGIEEMRLMRIKYDQLLKDAAGHMSDLGSKAGDQDVLIANLVQYGGVSWEAMKRSVDKAGDFEKQERRTECVAAWKEASDALSIAIHKMRTEYWLLQAETDAKDKLWAKVNIKAEKALAEDPENERAKALKAEAEKNSK